MGKPEPERRRQTKQKLEERRARNLARSCAQDRRADQDNEVPRRSPSGFVGPDDDYDQPE